MLTSTSATWVPPPKPTSSASAPQDPRRSQTTTFIAGIATQNVVGSAVHVTPDGLLGVSVSSWRMAEIYPELVVLDKEGQPSGVRYHVLPAMLLNELQRQHREHLAEQATAEARFAAQQREIDAQAWLIDELTARLPRLEARAPPVTERRRPLAYHGQGRIG